MVLTKGLGALLDLCGSDAQTQKPCPNRKAGYDALTTILYQTMRKETMPKAKSSKVPHPHLVTDAETVSAWRSVKYVKTIHRRT